MARTCRSVSQDSSHEGSWTRGACQCFRTAPVGQVGLVEHVSVLGQLTGE